MNHREEIILAQSDPDIDLCACGGTGYILINNDEDAKCPYHCSDNKDSEALDRMTEDELVTKAEEREVLEVLTGGDDYDYITDYLGR